MAKTDETLYVKNEELKEDIGYLKEQKQEHEPYKAQEELNAIHKYFPTMKEKMRIVELCEQIGLGFEPIRGLLVNKTMTGKHATLYSPEHKRHFEAKDIELKIEKDPDSPGKLFLSLNRQNIIDWFRQKFQKVKQVVNYYKRPSIKSEEDKNKGIKM